MAPKIISLCALAIALQGAAQAAPVAGADAALAWLTLVDHGAYAESWATAGTLFKSHISNTDWAGQLKPTREPLGAVISRKQASEREMTSLPGAPDGHYELLTFNTDFNAKKEAVETVILAAEPTGWKVDGYFIK